MPLTPPQEAFARAVGTGMSAPAAWRLHAGGGKCSTAAAQLKADEWLALPELADCVARHSVGRARPRRKTFKLTRSQWLARLLGLAENAEGMGEISAATAALREIGKAMAGWYQDEVEKPAAPVGTLERLVVRLRDR